MTFSLLASAQEAQNEQRWEDCVDDARKILKNEADESEVRFHGHDRLCHCQLKGGDAAEARKACSEALATRPDEPRILCDRAEAYLAEDMFDEVFIAFLFLTRNIWGLVG